MSNPNTNNSNQKANISSTQINKSMVLNRNEVEKSLVDIYNYYSRAYIQHAKEYS
jgi:hypothetical protein